jgi:hypothetical protein
VRTIAQDELDRLVEHVPPVPGKDPPLKLNGALMPVRAMEVAETSPLEKLSTKV